LTRLTDEIIFDFNEVVHGTYSNVIELITKSGLNKMARNEIHLAVGKPGKEGVISGMRGSCEEIIDVNLVRAHFDGKIPFFISHNNVVLTPGIEGRLSSEYFRTIFNRKKAEYTFMKPLDYIMVYDFECQCEDRDKGSASLNFNEIIEFPIVVVDVRTKAVVATF